MPKDKDLERLLKECSILFTPKPEQKRSGFINNLNQIAGIGTKLVLGGILAYGGWRVIDYALTPNPQTAIKQYMGNVRPGEYGYEQLKQMIVGGAGVTPAQANAYLHTRLDPKAVERAKNGEQIFVYRKK